MPTPEEMAAELETLRKTNAELLKKSQDRKAKIAELEGKVTASDTAVHELIVNRPLKQMAASLSVAPDTLITSLLTDYKVEMTKDGELAFLTLEGEPVIYDGKPVPFEREPLMKLLLATKDEAKLKLYNSILIASRASGSAHPTTKKTDAIEKPRFQFGLR